MFGRVARGREVWQGLLDLGGLARLALVHQAVGEGVLSCRPGLLGELEQHCPRDDAVVVVAEQLLQFLGLCGLAAGGAAESRACPSVAASHFSSAHSGRVVSRSMMPPKASSALRARRVATRIWCTASGSSRRTSGS